MSWQKNRRAVLLNIGSSLIILIISLGIVFNRQRILDQIIVWQFEPASAVMSLVDRAGMNDEGKFVYEASQPVLDATSNFNSVCSTIENTMSVLGCYTNNQIYVYDVSDKELDGIREVTAAHEALHAVYYRLSDGDKEKLATLLEKEYKKLENDSDYSDRMDFYAKTEPGERTNELHSVVGTEVADISSELEEYYSRFFADRQQVVKLYQKYSAVFKKLKSESDKLVVDLNNLADSINADVAKYNSSVIQLNSDIDSFNQRAEDGDFESNFEFNSERNALAIRVSSLNAQRDDINANIALYNKLLEKYNSNAARSEELYKSIDSTLAPAPSV